MVLTDQEFDALADRMSPCERIEMYRKLSAAIVMARRAEEVGRGALSAIVGRALDEG